jgi:hypothetical protein
MFPTAVSPLNFQPILIFDDTFKPPRENGRKNCSIYAPPGSTPELPSAILVFLWQQVQGLDLSQVGSDHLVRVASEDVYRWIEQLNSTVNVLRACSETFGDGTGLVC